ncbi:MAG TPA: hypothetical protein VIN06_03900 [Devosia sp.]
MKLSFLDVHVSQAVRGVAATVSEGVFVYLLFISPEALHDLGASDDVDTWLPTFHCKESLIAEQIRRMQRPAPDAPAILDSIIAS